MILNSVPLNSVPLNALPPAPPAPAGVQYRVYANAGDGGPIDYSVPVATVDGLEWITPVLAAPGAHRFGVRAFDAGLEEQNVDAAVLIVLDDAGNDVSNRPAPPFGLRLRSEAGGVVVAEWSHPGGTAANRPAGFRVYVGHPTPDYATPYATVAASQAFAGVHAARLTGLADGPLSVAVRAYNATAEEGNADFLTITVDGTPPDPVDGLTAQATATDG